MPSTGDGTIPDDVEDPGKDPHPRLLGAQFEEELSAVPLAQRVPGTWESVNVSDVPDVGHVALRFATDGTLEMAAYGLDGKPSNRQAGTYRVEADSVSAEFPGSPEAKVSFEGDALILEDVGSGAKVRFRKRGEELPLEDVSEEQGGA